MVGGGIRKNEGSFMVSNSNVFAALDSSRKKKKSGSKAAVKPNEAQVYWAPAPLTASAKSWADVDDEDDDDYYATAAPPQATWGGSGSEKAQDSHNITEESESEDELLDETEDDKEDEPEHETDAQQHSVEIPPAPAEKQLSKKERRKKELAELEAILADFGLDSKQIAEDRKTKDMLIHVTETPKNMKEVQVNGEEEKTGMADSKTSNKKKKKKDKASKEETDGDEQAENNTSPVDVKKRLKKIAPAKKKKSTKEMDGASRAAALEAAARSAKLASAKKKEKNHYNQQPTR